MPKADGSCDFKRLSGGILGAWVLSRVNRQSDFEFLQSRVGDETQKVPRAGLRGEAYLQPIQAAESEKNASRSWC